MYMSLYFSKIYMYNYIFLYASTDPSPQAGDVVASQLQAQHCRWEGPRTSRRSGGWENKWWWLGKQIVVVQQYLLLFTCSLLSSFCFCSVMSSSFSCFEPRRVRAVNEYEYVPMLNIKIQKYKNVCIRLKYLRTMWTASTTLSKLSLQLLAKSIFD